MPGDNNKDKPAESRTRMDHCLADLGALEDVLREHGAFEEVALLIAVAMASIDLGVAADALAASMNKQGIALPEMMERAKRLELQAMLAAAKQRWALLVGALQQVPEDGFGVNVEVTRKIEAPETPVPAAGGDEAHATEGGQDAGE